MRSIILEGYDGAGKSNLAFRLGNHFKLLTYVAGPPARDDAHAIECCDEQIAKIKEGFILDRVTPISRLCYQEGLSESHMDELSKKMREMLDQAIVIWCCPDTHIHRPGDHDTAEHLADIEAREEQIRTNYVEIMSYVPHVNSNWQSDNYDLLVRHIEHLMGK